MNDIRVTQYALGELAGQEREDFERDLAGSETLQRELNETLQIAETLGKLPMPGETLTEEQREGLRKECLENQEGKKRRGRGVRLLIGLGAIAAVICLLASLSLPAITSNLTKGQKVAVADTRLTGPPLVAGEKAAASKMTAAAAQMKADLAEAAPPSEVPAATPAPMTIADATALQEKEAMRAAILAERGAMLAETPQNQFATGHSTSGNVASANVAGNKAAEGLAASSVDLRSNPQPSAPETRAQVTGGTRLAGDVPLQGRLFRAEGNFEKRGKASAPDEKTSLRPPSGPGNTEAYDAIEENVFLTARENPLSTFSIDVDTASYANVRRFLQSDQAPPAGAIRTEELLNYFPYAYPQPASEAPFSVNLEVTKAPWDAKRELVRIGLKGRELPAGERGPANLVFLVDVSGSMDQPDKLPLLKRSLQELVKNLTDKDRVAMVVYAGSSGLVLPSTSGKDKARILEALENLKAGGSTNGASGIKLAYETAREHFLKEGNNRVILCTDGDFNVGTTSQSQLVRLIEKERASGVFLSVLGFGTGNLKDSTMEKLAGKGNGNYAYIDSLTEARKVLVEQMGSTLFTIAKDVKIQVEFNPARVAGYRLIGYENRLLAKEDFNDDKKDAGEIGAGHTVTALYEIIPAGQPLPNQPSVDPLKYQAASQTGAAQIGDAQDAAPGPSTELLTVKLRYKAPDGDKSKLIEVPLPAPEIPEFGKGTSDFQFAAAVAAFGMKLRGSPMAGEIGWGEIQKIVRRNLGEDPGSYRAEFLTLIERAARLKPDGREVEE